MEMEKRGATGFQLKLLALIVMTMDHIAVYMPESVGIPMWFRYVGRLAAPIFVYLCVEGFSYTRSRTKYLAKMYTASVLMKTASLALCIAFQRPSGVTIMNDMFSTMFVICWIIFAIERLRTPNRRERGAGALMLLGMAVVTVLSVINLHFPLWLLRVRMVLLSGPLTCEGGILWVILGVGFYYLRRNRLGLIIWFGAFCALHIGLLPFNLANVVYILCIFAAIVPICLYNGKPGRHRCKWLFYIYYPVHVWVLYLIGWWMETH